MMTSEPQTGVSWTCDRLSKVFPHLVSYPNSTTYKSSTASYFFSTARQSPRCIISPSSVEDVAGIIKIIGNCGETRFAIRSGGHSPHPNIANIENGVTIDLSALQSIDTDEREDVLRVGAGLKWGDVYLHLASTNRTIVGARVSSVGVGGFMSGGGLSFFAPERGFACDSVINFQVVLATGDIVEVNAESHKELYDALKGGQNNFGIITRFDILTHVQETMWGGGLHYPEETEDLHLKAFLDLKRGEYDPFAGIEMSFLYLGPSKRVIVSNNMVYVRPIADGHKLRRFAEIQPQIKNTMRIDSAESFARELDRVQPKNQHAIYLTTTFFITPTVFEKINLIWKEASKKVPEVKDFLSVLTYQQFPPQSENSPNAMGFALEDKLHEKLIIVILSMYWADGNDRGKVDDAARGIIHSIELCTKQEKAYHPYKYVNYAGPWQNPMGSYGEEALERLRGVSEKYDPNGVFQKQAVGFKLTQYLNS